MIGWTTNPAAETCVTPQAAIRVPPLHTATCCACWPTAASLPALSKSWHAPVRQGLSPQSHAKAPAHLLVPALLGEQGGQAPQH